MEKWLQKIYNNWVRYLLLFLISIMIFLILVHILFKVRLGIYWIEAEWSAGDILSFGGSILSFVGTVVLGCITTKVSIDNNSINQRLAEIESKREKLEEDKRLGYIVPEQVKISFHEHFSEQNKDGSESHGWSENTKCTAKTSSIIFRLHMKLTSESIINRVTCKSLKICKYGFDDDFSVGISRGCWVPFYDCKEKFHRGINQMDNSFEEIVILSKSDKDTSAFEEMKKLLLLNVPYVICINFEYVNTLQEVREETLQLECCQNRIIKSELVL